MRFMSALLLLLALGIPATADPGLESITADGLMATVEHLASDEFEGRLAGTPGYDAAADWAARRFAAAGLESVCPDGYLQRFPIECNVIDAPCRLEIRRDGELIRDCILGEDFACRGFTGSGVVSAPVVFVGYGLSLPGRGYDDYAGVDVSGAVVLCFKPLPKWSLDDEAGWGEVHLPRERCRVAAAHGAVGLLMVGFPEENARKPIASVLHGPGEQDERFPAAQIDVPIVDELLAGAGLDLAGLREAIDSARAPHSVATGAEATMEIHARYDAAAPTSNVVAVLRGRDPELADEYVVFGAHIDHVGAQAGVVYPGANDNASGSAAVLALAEAFAVADPAPDRSLVFVLFSGEEQGLNGARRYAENPPVPLERTVAMFNFDCIAHGDSIRVGGGKSAPDMWRLARDLDADGDRLMTAATWKGGGADATPFFEAGVKTLYWVTTNSYTHLHAPTDMPDTLNPELFESLVRLAYRTAGRVAGRGFVPTRMTEDGE